MGTTRLSSQGALISGQSDEIRSVLLQGVLLRATQLPFQSHGNAERYPPLWYFSLLLIIIVQDHDKWRAGDSATSAQ